MLLEAVQIFIMHDAKAFGIAGVFNEPLSLPHTKRMLGQTQQLSRFCQVEILDQSQLLRKIARHTFNIAPLPKIGNFT